MEYKKLEFITKKEAEEIFSTTNDKLILIETWFRMINYINDVGFIEKYTTILINNNTIEKTRIIDGILGYVIINREIPDFFVQLIDKYSQDNQVGLLAQETYDHIKLLIKNKIG